MEYFIAAAILLAFLGAFLIWQIRRAFKEYRYCVSCNRQLIGPWCHICGRPQSASSIDKKTVLYQLALLISSDSVDEETRATLLNLLNDASSTAPSDEEQSALSGPVAHQSGDATESQLNSDTDSEDPITLQPSAETVQASSLGLEKEHEDGIPHVGFDVEPAHAASLESTPDPVLSIPIPPAHVRRPFRAMFLSFMEEKNIWWGELVGGLMVVLGSAALVMSQWSRITATPLLLFGLFTLVTACVFGLGLYTAHRWKLLITSRWVLTFSLLLVPLNFLAITGMGVRGTMDAQSILLCELIGVAIYLALSFPAARVVTPLAPWSTSFGVVATSVWLLITRRYTSGTEFPVWALASCPIATYLTASFFQLRAQRMKDVEIPSIRSSLTSMGTTLCALVVTLAFILSHVENLGEAASSLAPWMSLCGLPLLVYGLRTNQSLQGLHRGISQTIALSLSIFGGCGMMSGLIIAWPNTTFLIVVGSTNFVCLTVAAIYFRTSHAHVLAAVHKIVALVLLAHLLLGNLGWGISSPSAMVSVLTTLESGVIFAGLWVLEFAFSLVMARLVSSRAKTSYQLIAAILWLLSVVLLVLYGFEDQVLGLVVSLAFTVNAGGAIVAAHFINRKELAWCASLTSFAMISHFCVTLIGHHLTAPWLTATLVHSGLIAILFAIPAIGHKARNSATWTQSSLLTGTAAGLLFLFAMNGLSSAEILVHGVTLTLVWLVISYCRTDRNSFIVAQVVSFLTASCFVTSSVSAEHWYAAVHPWHLQLQGIACGLVCLGWNTTRHFHAWILPGVSRVHDWLAGVFKDDRLILEFRVTLLFVVLTVVSGLFAIVPGITEYMPDASISTSLTLLAGPRGWICGVLALANLILAARFHREVLALAPLLVVSLIMLLAVQLSPSETTIRTALWLLGFLLASSSLVLWRLGLSENVEPQTTRSIRGCVLISMALPIVVLTMLCLTGSLLGHHPPTSPDSFWNDIHSSIAYSAALCIVTLVLALHAVGSRSGSIAFLSVIACHVSVTTAFIYSVLDDGRLLSDVDVIHLIQVNALSSSLSSILWIVLRKWHESKKQIKPDLIGGFLGAHLGFAGLLHAIILVPAELSLLVLIPDSSKFLEESGSILGWVAMGSLIACWILLGVRRRAGLIGAPTLLALGLGSMISLTFAGRTNLTWGFNSLLTARTIAAWLPLLLILYSAWLRPSGSTLLKRTRIRPPESWTMVVGLLVFLLAVRGSFRPQPETWWSVGAGISLSVTFLMMGWMTCRRRYLAVSVVLFTMTSAIWEITIRTKGINFDSLMDVMISALALSSAIAWIIDLRWIRPLLTSRASVHQLSLWVLVVVVFGKSSLSLIRHLFEVPGSGVLQTSWISLGVVAILAALCLRDRRIRFAAGAAYMLGLSGLVLALSSLELSLVWSGWVGQVFLASYGILTSYLWCKRPPPKEQADPKSRSDNSEWLVLSNLAIAWSVVGLSFVLCFCDTNVFSTTPIMATSIRLLAAKAGVTQVISIALLAYGDRRARLQVIALGISAVAMVAWGWAWIPPQSPLATLLNYLTVLFVTLGTALAFYAIVLGKLLKRENDWSGAARRLVPYLGVGTGLSLLALLGSEIPLYLEYGIAAMHPVAIGITSAVLGAMTVGLIVLAVVPGKDPLDLSERGRTGYVYGAEVGAVLLVLHLRLTVPSIFLVWGQYWPFAVIAVSFVGVGLSEFFRRDNRLVLSEPLMHTGVFLPILPVLGFLIGSQQAVSIQLFSIGLLYGVLAVSRKSFRFGVLAAVFANSGLWYILHHAGSLGFLQHPQLWVLPASLSVLFAAHINRNALNSAQMTSIRYFCLMAIYVSSTADIFLNGVRDSPWLPLILGTLSVAGIALGIMMRVRSFMFLGSGFLLLSLITMILHAHLNLGWDWLWYLAVVVVGLLILVVFALFEKKRSAFATALQELKQWDN